MKLVGHDNMTCVSVLFILFMLLFVYFLFSWKDYLRQDVLFAALLQGAAACRAAILQARPNGPGSLTGNQ
jgi:hypothetical protein